jgi:hypothetical protein
MTVLMSFSDADVMPSEAVLQHLACFTRLERNTA